MNEEKKQRLRDLYNRMYLTGYEIPKISKQDIESYYQICLLLKDVKIAKPNFKEVSSKGFAMEALSSINLFPSSRIIDYLKERLKDINIVVNRNLSEDDSYAFSITKEDQVIYQKIAIPKVFTEKTLAILAHEFGHVIYEEHHQKDSYFYSEVIPKVFEYLSIYPNKKAFSSYCLQLEKEHANDFLHYLEEMHKTGEDKDYRDLVFCLVLTISYFMSTNVLFQIIRKMNTNPYLTFSYLDKLCFGEISMETFFETLGIDPKDTTLYQEIIASYTKENSFSLEDLARKVTNYFPKK